MNDDLDDAALMHDHTMEAKSEDTRASRNSNISVNDQRNGRGPLKAHENMTGASAETLGNESQRSVGEILSSMNQELHQSVSGSELLAEKGTPRLTNPSIGSAKKSTFWGKKNVSVFLLSFPG